MMNSTRLLILAALTLPFTACSETNEPEQGITEPAVQQEAEPETAPTTPVAVVEESAGEATPAEDATPVDAGTNDKIILGKAETPAAPAAQKYEAVTHYVKLTTAQGTSSPPDVVEVAEVFWYGCPHCFNFDPVVHNWAENLPDKVNFIRLPVMWNPTNAMHARLFYTLEALGKLEEVHHAIFTEMHVNKKMLTSEAEIMNFIDRQGISTDDFRKTFRSFAVESKLNRAKNLTWRYQIQSVPLLVINGAYLTTGKGIKNFDDMLAVADELIAREQQNR
ncbi:MAG: DsbA family protein [Gammaproteobacteria bacterium]|jgi:thiol:disulfide interchange protein DsbA|nr:DsbA family protein [Gammaproteobacteria bacterium]